MKQKFAEFLFKRISKKVDDLENELEFGEDVPVVHIEDLQVYLKELQELLLENF